MGAVSGSTGSSFWQVTEDGRVSVSPEDDFYGGELSADDSRELALAILKAQAQAQTERDKENG